MTFRARLGLQSHHTILLRVAAVFLTVLIFSADNHAIEPRDYAIEASVEVLTEPLALRLTWVPSAVGGTYTIRRRIFGSTDWGGSRASLSGSSSAFTDTDISEGVAYEYEIRLETTVPGSGARVNAYGYILAGANVLWPDAKGKVLLVVESTVAGTLNAEVNLFHRDLLGAGWLPIRRDLPRLSSVADVKNLVRAEYNADPANLRAVILLGHVPVPYSGNIAPDLHESHRGAWPADVYYADIDGTWTDNTVNIASGDYPANDNRPGDGKFDQSQIPSTVELEIGRIDFYDLPAFSPRTLHDLLRSYLRKNSEFRHRQFTASRRMLVRDNFGDLSGDAPAVDAWRHYRQMFGPGNIREVGPGAFFSTLQNESYLWAYGGGGGGNTKADTIGTTWDFAAQNPQAVFLILHGSYFGDWNTKDNFLRAAVGGQNYTLASIWSGLPHWFMHSMALGRSIGDSTRLNQNNINDYKTHQNFSAQQVHVSLIGDPTLENFPVMPPKNFIGSAVGSIDLNWTSSSDENIVGYHVYYSTSGSGPFQRITESPLTGTAFSHQVGTGTHHYMVRAVKLERTGSGTFYNFSQGLFGSVTKTSGGSIPQINITAEDADTGETGPDSGTVRIRRSFADENPLTVDFLIGGTAANGIDYVSIGNSVVIGAWETDGMINVLPLTDNQIEGDETMTIQIHPSANYTVGSPPSAVLKIKDGVNRPPTISQIADISIEAGSMSGDLAFQVSDPETAASDLQVTGESSNEQIVPHAGITFGGSGAGRTVRINTAGGGSGVVSITLTVSDGVNQTIATFDVTVTQPNLQPTAVPQTLETVENSSVVIVLQGQDPEGQSLTYHIKTQPTNGSLVGAPPNVTYTPVSNYFGSDVFSFSVNDGKTESAPAEISVSITPRNRPPVALPAEIDTVEDESVAITLAATDSDEDVLDFEIVLRPTKGALTGSGNSYVYAPNTNAFGSDMFTFRVRDGEFASAVAEVSLLITPINDAPVAKNEILELVEDEELSLLLAGSDPDGDPISFEVISLPTNGVLSGRAPNFTYKPATNFNGEGTLRYIITDGAATSYVGTITLTIQAINDAPVVLAQTVSTAEDSSVNIQIAATDVDSDSLTFQVLAPPKKGVLSGEAPDLIYTPAPDLNGEDSFMIMANDGVLDSSPATVNIYIEPRNDPPTISTLAPQSASKNSTVGPLFVALTDPDRPISELVFWAESSNSGLIPTNRIALASNLTNREITLFPNSGVVGVSTITVNVFDGEATAQSSFLLTITNTPPLPGDDHIVDTAGTVVIPVEHLLANDQDPDNDHLRIVSVARSNWGKSVQLTNDTIVYRGSTNILKDAFSYVVEDTSFAQASAKVSLTLSSLPRINSVRWVSGGLQFQLSGPPNSEFQVWASEDAVNWVPVGEGTSDPNGKGEFTEGGGASLHHRLYKIEWP